MTGALTEIEEESGTVISDTASNLSNFQMPQKDLIDEINRQKESMMVNTDDPKSKSFSISSSNVKDGSSLLL